MNWYKLKKQAIFNHVISPGLEYHDVQESIYDVDESHTIPSMEAEIESLRKLALKIYHAIGVLKNEKDKKGLERTNYLLSMDSRIKERISKLVKRISFMHERPVHDRGLITSPIKQQVNPKPIESDLNKHDELI